MRTFLTGVRPWQSDDGGIGHNRDNNKLDCSSSLIIIKKIKIQKKGKFIMRANPHSVLYAASGGLSMLCIYSISVLTTIVS